MTAADVVVIGGGVAGLLTATAVANAGGTCTVIERDHRSGRPAPRRGVPHGHQLHNVLTRGQRSLEILLPGIVDELLAAGASRASVGDQTIVREYGAVVPRRRLGLHILSAPQPVFEDAIRRRTLEMPGVTVLEGASVTGLTVLNERVAGVCTDHDNHPTVAAGFGVFDASGATARSTHWLEKAGLGGPPVDTVTRGRWYASAIASRPRHLRGDPTFRLWFPDDRTGSGLLMSPAGPDHWYVSANGREPDLPPHDATSLVGHCSAANSGGDPAVPTDPASFTTPVSVYHRPVARWRRWELWQDAPDGIIAIGDSLATLDPLHGQGLSVAAWQAAELHRCMRADGITSAPVRSALARVAQTAWELPDLMDRTAYEFPGGVTGLVEQLGSDAELHKRYVECWHLVGDPTQLAAHSSIGVAK